MNKSFQVNSTVSGDRVQVISIHEFRVITGPRLPCFGGRTLWHTSTCVLFRLARLGFCGARTARQQNAKRIEKEAFQFEVEGKNMNNDIAKPW